MLGIKYIIFAVISTIVNILFQYFTFFLYDGLFSLYIAMFIGTLSGLILKYILDKKYIFYYKTQNKKDDGKKFFLYSLMGVFTTLVFWGFEISFYHFFEDKNAKYLGAIIGLSIGYIIKYYLDKKFVFVHKKDKN
ncbi:GtrA family protein [Campylobacterota bacterium DY0563]